MNGALGTLKGYMWVEGGDPNSSDSMPWTFLCCIVEFDDVNFKDENGVLRTFFLVSQRRLVGFLCLGRRCIRVAMKVCIVVNFHWC